MLHTFEFNNKKLSDIGAVLMENPHYTLSVKELDFTALPGKSGDIITDKNRFRSSSISYKVSSMPLFCSYTEQEFVYALSEWLLTSYDYKILRDTYNPGYFRKAICTDIANPTVEASGVVWTTVTFNCDPFRYSDSGLQKRTFNASYSNISDRYIVNKAILRNSEKWESEPIIEIIPSSSATMSLKINETSVAVYDTDKTIIIDVPNRNVYDTDGEPCNDLIEALELPVLLPGNNEITASGTGSYTVKITPNWRRL